MNQANLRSFCDFLLSDSTDDICFACHVSPDGDSVGSAVALARLVRARGRRAFVYLPEPLSQSLAFLLEGFDNTPFEPKLAVAVDVSTPDRLGDDFPYANKLAAVIDHHRNNSFSLPVSFVETEAAACGLLVLRVFDEVGEPLTPAVATALYTAISTDTGRFCHSNSTEDVFLAAARLARAVPAGNFGDLNRRLFVLKPAAHLRLEGYILDRAVTDEKRGLVFFALTRALRKKFAPEGTDADLTGLVDVLRAFNGFDTCVLAKETEEKGVFKLSVRTEGAVSATAICAHFQGGGHTKAAGATVRAKSPRALLKTLCAVLDTERAKLL